MDTYEATKAVMSRVQSLDPENASKIMGYILIQDQGEKEMIRLAFGPEALLQSYISQAKACLRIPSSNPSTPLPFPPQRILIPNNGFHHSNPSSPAAASFPRPFSYAAALNGSNDSSSSNSGSSLLQQYLGGSDFGSQNEFLSESTVDPIMSPSGRSDSLVFPYGDDGVPSPHAAHHPFHRRSCSVNDAVLEGGLGWRPCMYFARGFCKNGSSCKFLHSDSEAMELGLRLGSPSKNSNSSSNGLEELLRKKALQQQQQRFALMNQGHHPFSYNKCMDFLNESPRSAAAALMMDDEFHKFNRYRNDFTAMGMGLVGGPNSSSRQIYLTFPADSTFKEEDVSNYFSMFGPVQDVRIPYQQKRMFGFVTFVYAETVKLILAKGNPHFVCDSRVLVKPYKEKGKIPDKKQHHQQFERGDCLSPCAIDSREQIDHLPFGSRMLSSTEELMLRRKLEDAELHHAIELEGRRMMNLQLMDLKNQHNQNHHILPSFSSPRQSQLLINQTTIAAASDSNNIPQDPEEFDGSQETASKSSVFAAEFSTNNVVGGNKPHKHVMGDDERESSLEHNLPDNLFASPTKLTAENQSAFPHASASTDGIAITSSNDNNTPAPPIISSLKPCYIQMQSH